MGYVGNQPAQPPTPQTQGYAPPPNQAYGQQPGQYSAYAYPAPPPPYAANNEPDRPEGTEEEAEPEPPFVDLAVTTVFPLYVGGQASLELPGRFMLAGDIGGMPSAYGSVINDAIQGFAGYDDNIANLVDGSFESALVARLSAAFVRSMAPVSSSGAATRISHWTDRPRSTRWSPPPTPAT